MSKKIYEYTIITDDPLYLNMVADQIEYGYHSGYVDHAHQWERRYIGESEDDDED